MFVLELWYPYPTLLSNPAYRTCLSDSRRQLPVLERGGFTRSATRPSMRDVLGLTVVGSSVRGSTNEKARTRFFPQSAGFLSTGPRAIIRLGDTV